MKRKILKVGNASLAVSLPSKWARPLSLSPGDEIDVEEEGNQLIISPSRMAVAEEEVVIRVTKERKFYKRLILAPYIQGYNVIKVFYEGQDARKQVEETLVNYMFGFDIIEQTPTHMTLKNIARGIEDEFPSMFLRTLYLIEQIVEELIATVETGETAHLEELKNYNAMIDKINVFCRRLLNTRVRMETSRITAAYRTICMVEEIGDEYHDIAKRMERRLGDLPTERFGALLKRVRKIHSGFTKLYAQPTIESIIAFNRRCEEEKERITHLLEGKPADFFALMKVAEILERLRSITEEMSFPFADSGKGPESAKSSVGTRDA